MTETIEMRFRDEPSGLSEREAQAIEYLEKVTGESFTLTVEQFNAPVPAKPLESYFAPTEIIRRVDVPKVLVVRVHADAAEKD
jgi:hypothetical protein